MAAIDYLKQRGLSARRVGSRIRVIPKAKITEDVRQFVRAHRLELLSELAANDGLTRRIHWQVTRSGKPLCVMIGEPMTYDEALAAARYRWADAEVT